MAPKQSDALKFIQGGFPFVILTVGGWLGISYTLQKRIDAQAGTGLGEGGGRGCEGQALGLLDQPQARPGCAAEREHVSGQHA